MNQEQQQKEQKPVTYGDMFSVSGELAKKPVAPQDAAMMQAAEATVFGGTQKGGTAAAMQKAAGVNERCGFVGRDDVTMDGGHGVTVTATELPGARVVTETVDGQWELLNLWQTRRQFLAPFSFGQLATGGLSHSLSEATPVLYQNDAGVGDVHHQGVITIGEALEATARTAGSKAVEQSDAAAIQAAEVRATGSTLFITGEVAAQAQSAATLNTSTRDEDKVTLSEVLTDATVKLPADKAATREDADGVFNAERRNNPNSTAHPTGVAASISAAANLNEKEFILELESPISNEDIRTAVWGCGVDKSPGPDGFTFEFFCKYWTVVGPDFCIAVKWFFDHGDFAIGCNSSFVALIPKVLDPKVVSDYRPISLIGSLYKVVTKILASRLSLVISDLISDVQTAFLPNRQILDGPFIINEILARCKLKKQQAMIFKVDFAKAYDSVRWDYLDDVLISFGFGPKWRSWIRGSLSSGKASILVNGSPTTEFHLYRGLKQGDPLAPFLFLLIMESLHLSFSRAVEAGIFKGYKIDPSTTLSHLFYADDAVFIGEWSHSNLKGIMNILRCFSLLSGMSINIQKSHLLGVGIPDNCVAEAAKSIGCLIMKAPFKYLGILVGDNMSSKKAWDETINKMKKRLSRWKLNTLSVGGRLTLLKSVLGSTPIYNMSIFKVPKSVLNYMESLRRNFFNGFQEGDRKIAWVKWSKVLASKKFGGFTWLEWSCSFCCFHSTWSSIITEVNSLKVKGVDLISHCKIRVGKGTGTSFWKDLWIGDNLLKLSFPRLFALEENKDISVADKMNTSISSSFRRHVRGGVGHIQLDKISFITDRLFYRIWMTDGFGT
ncbi:RNA-directed DNA polymerase, eukaryota [Tanacetum coccineum]|uniref:RNA-directed DNA polymerase, eukaryota n=1 Tax=Tanacetum coccineum TaxID=301880 RepID=A0ABQ5H3G2_9ASTR